MLPEDLPPHAWNSNQEGHTTTTEGSIHYSISLTFSISIKWIKCEVILGTLHQQVPAPK